MNTQAYTADFPLLTKHPDLVYLDSAATSLTPAPVLAKMDAYYSDYGANVSRGIYAIAERATREYEDVRSKAASFIGASSPDDIIFTAGTTASINMIARGLQSARSSTEGLRVVVTAMDHHANFVPWQQVAQPEHFGVASLTPEYTLDREHLKQLLTAQTDVLALPYISNVLGTVNPLVQIIAIAREISPHIIVVVDAAQAAPHIPIDVAAIDCDFLALSAHKMYGPTGTGILWGKKEHLEKLTPLLTGGDMIAEVSSAGTTYRDLPHRLEAGTPNIAGVIGLGAAIDYIQSIGVGAISSHERALTAYAYDALHSCDGVTIYGPDRSVDRIGVIAFTVDGVHPHDLASILDTEYSVAIRAGNHCAMPLHVEHLRLPATARMSVAVHTTTKDIDTLIAGIHKAKEIFTN